MSEPVLVSIGFSPWSLRAKMALDLAEVKYRKKEYLPTVGEPWLRWQLGRWRGPVTVPVLLSGDGPPLTDSFDIAAWASSRGAPWLVPPAERAAITRWNEVANRALEAGRLRTTRRVLASPAGLLDSLPPPVRALGPLAPVIGRRVAGGLLEKYGGARLDDAACEAQLVAALEALREGLQGRDWLCGAFSYADITGAAALSFVSPHAKAKIGDLSRSLWTEPHLADRFAELLSWRDRVYERWSARGSFVPDPV